jgi:hypothetical protein
MMPMNLEDGVEVKVLSKLVFGILRLPMTRPRLPLICTFAEQARVP